MIRSLQGERWNALTIKSIMKVNYAVSNFGRVISYTDNFDEGIILKCSENKNYKLIRINHLDEGNPRNTCFYVHKLVAEHFLPPPNEDQKAVIHIDYIKTNNHFKNLRWVSKSELDAHHKTNPVLIKQRKKLLDHNRRSDNGFKLTEEKVRILKRKLLDPNRKTRLKMLARQFGVSEMQLHRIKTGENWGYVKVDK